MTRILASLLSLFAFLVLPVPARAAVTPSPLFSDHAVLQRGMPIPVWGTAEPGEEVTVRLADRQVSVQADEQGQWEVRLPAQEAGGPFELKVGDKVFKDVMIGDVWILAGQSNMEMKFGSADTYEQDRESMVNEGIRLFRVDIAAFDKDTHNFPNPAVDPPINHTWVPSTAENAGYAMRFSGVGMYFGRDLARELDVPIGLIAVAMGGTKVEAWTPREVVESHPTGREIIEKYNTIYKPAYVNDTGTAVEQALGQPQDEPAALYNSFLHPLTRYGIKGMFWYQGEHNTNAPEYYEWNLAAFVEAMRGRFPAPADDFPFLVMQIHPYGRPAPRDRDLGDSGQAGVREAQANVVNAGSNMALVVSIDLADGGNIHPANKRAYGERAARTALGAFYDRGEQWRSSLFESAEIEGDRAVITFAPEDQALKTSDGNPPTGFVVRAEGEDRWRRAEARIVDGNKIEVRHPEVTAIEEVRYAWENLPEVNLYNAAGLPVGPFSTRTTRPAVGQ